MTTIERVRANRRNPGAVGRFAAPPELATSLQAVLVDLVELQLQARQTHWNLVGPNFRDLHLQLDAVVDTAREAADVVAERMRAVRAVPDGRSETVVATTTLPALPGGVLSTADAVTLIVDAVAAAVMTVRGVRETVEAADPPSVDVLHTIIDDLEKQAWLLGSETSAG
jgi:starvation-inducible DNA-binding protein